MTMTDYEDLAWRIHALADDCGDSPVDSRFYGDLQGVFIDLGRAMSVTEDEIADLLKKLKENHTHDD